MIKHLTTLPFSVNGIGLKKLLIIFILIFGFSFFVSPLPVSAAYRLDWNNTPISAPTMNWYHGAQVIVPVDGADNDRFYTFKPSESGETRIFVATIDETTGTLGSFHDTTDDNPSYYIQQAQIFMSATYSQVGGVKYIHLAYNNVGDIYTIQLDASGDIVSIVNNDEVLPEAVDRTNYLKHLTISGTEYLYFVFQNGSRDIRFGRCEINNSDGTLSGCGFLYTDSTNLELYDPSYVYYEASGEKYFVLTGGVIDNETTGRDNEDTIRAYRLNLDGTISNRYEVGTLPQGMTGQGLVVYNSDIYAIGGYRQVQPNWGTEEFGAINDTYVIEDLVYNSGANTVLATSVNKTSQQTLPFPGNELVKNTVLQDYGGKGYVFTNRFIGPEIYYGVVDPAADITGPVIEFSEFSEGLVGKTFTYTGTATDVANNVVTLEWWVDGSRGDNLSVTSGDLDSLSESFDNDFGANDTSLDEGVHTLEIVAIDAEGNETRESFEIDIDASSPTCTSSWYNLPTPQYVSIFSYTNITCTDNRSIQNAGYSSYHSTLGSLLNWNDYQIAPVDGFFGESSETFSFTADLSGLGNIDGGLNITLIVYDEAGNASYDQDPLAVDVTDDTAPTVNIDVVAPDPLIDTTPTITGSCIDDTPRETDTYISLLEYKVDAEAYQNITLPNGGSYDDSYYEAFSLDLSELSLGSHTVTIRCTDGANHSATAADTFEIIAPTSPEPGDYTFSEDFDTQLNQDLPNSNNVIWGNGKLRLKEDITLTRTLINDENLCGRYDSCGGHAIVQPDPADSSLLWYYQGGDIYYYNTITNTNTKFDYAALYGLTEMTTAISQIRLGVYQGKKYIIFSDIYSLTVINITDGVGYNDSSYHDTTNFALDFNRGRMGMYLNINDEVGTANFAYLNFNGTAIQNDDTLTYMPLSVINYDALGNTLLDPSTNAVYVAAYGIGFYKFNDQNTPGDFTDDVVTVYDDVAYENIFGAMTLDPNGKLIFGTAGNLTGKIFVITSDGGTPFDSVDDTVTQIGSPILTSYRSFYGVQYVQGENGIGDQLFLNTEDGDPFYVNFNSTYTNPNDDTFIDLLANAGVRPGGANIYVYDYNTLYSENPKQGFYKIDLNRGWVDTGRAVALPTRPPEELVVDNFVADAQTDVVVAYAPVLPDVQTTFFAGLMSQVIPQAHAAPEDGISYYVSTDGGMTWSEVTLNELHQLQQADYRVKFKVEMTEVSGSTPILDSYTLSYGGYPSTTELNTVTALTVTNSTSAVAINTGFNVTVEAVDVLGYKVASHDSTATLTLIDTNTNSVTTGLNQNTASINDGSVTLSGVQISKKGTFRIRATSGELSADSGVITVTQTENLPSVVLEFWADSYKIKSGETTTVRWTSQNLDSFTANPGDRKFSSSSGSFQVSPTQTTVFSMTGSGPYGGVTQTFTILVEGAVSVPNGVSPSPLPLPLGDPDTTAETEILSSDLQLTTSADQTIIKGQKAAISWQTFNADRVTIDYLNRDVSTTGSFEFFPAQTTVVTITAYRGEEQQQKQVITSVIEAPLAVQQGARTFQQNFPELTDEATTILQVTQYLPGLSLVLATIIRAFTAVLLLLTVASQASWSALNAVTIADILRAAGILPFKKRKGFVHQTRTGKPIPFALISIYEVINSGKQLVMTLVSDVYGNYFEPYLNKGTYLFDAAQPEHRFPTKSARPPHLSLFDFYKGETVSVNSNKQQQALLIPMDIAENKVESFPFKYRLLLGIKRVLSLLRWTVYPLTILAYFAVYMSPNIFNYLIATFYTLFMAVRVAMWLKKPTLKGKVIISSTKKGLEFATILLSTIDGLSVAMTKSDARGNFEFFVTPGSYTMNIISDRYRVSQDQLTSLNLIKAKPGAAAVTFIVVPL